MKEAESKHNQFGQPYRKSMVRSVVVAAFPSGEMGAGGGGVGIGVSISAVGGVFLFLLRPLPG